VSAKKLKRSRKPMKGRSIIDRSLKSDPSYLWIFVNLEIFISGSRTRDSAVRNFIVEVGLGISRTNADYQWNPVYNAFHPIFFFVKTKRFVGSSLNVILTRQTCGQRSSRAAESKLRALGNHFPERICYMFIISKCRRD